MKSKSSLIETVPGVASVPYLGPVKGNHGFLFEFKLAKGALKFIRYHEGDREFATSNYVFYALSDACNWPMVLRQGLQSYAGINERIHKLVLSFVQSNPNAY